MKIGDRVSVRLGREHRVAFGVLECFDAGKVIVRFPDGDYVVRDLKRVKPEAVGRREHAQKVAVDLRRRR